MTLTHLYLVERICCAWAHSKCDPHEVRSAAMVGLWQAHLLYDPARGAKFATFAWAVMNTAIVERVREVHKLRRKVWKVRLQYGDVPEQAYEPVNVDRDLLAWARSTLSWSDRITMVLVAYEGFEPGDVAEAFGICLAAVYYRLRRITDTMRRRIRHAEEEWTSRRPSHQRPEAVCGSEVRRA